MLYSACYIIYIFERLFGFTTDLTLLELSDTNNKLRELAEKAPGTFQHSLQVASIAEELTREVGEISWLNRSLSDIGKHIIRNILLRTDNRSEPA